MEFVKNIWMIRHWFVTKYGDNSVINSSDQMSIQRNESCGGATLNFRRQSQSTYVKGNDMLSKERVTIMTTTSSQNSSHHRT